MPAGHVPGRVAAVCARRRNDEPVDRAVAGSVVGRVCRVGCGGRYLAAIPVDGSGTCVISEMEWNHIVSN